MTCDVGGLIHAAVARVCGSDMALETADVALMADDPGQLPFAVGLSRQASRTIRQNLWMSLGVVAALIPATLPAGPQGRKTPRPSCFP